MFSQGGGCFFFFFEIVPHALHGTRCVDDIPLALNPPQIKGRLCTVRQWRTCLLDGQLQVQSSTLLSCPCQISICLARFLHMRRSQFPLFFEVIWVFEPFSVVIVFHSSRSYCSDGAIVLCRLLCGCPTASIHSSEQHFYPFRTVFHGVTVGASCSFELEN